MLSLRCPDNKAKTSVTIKAQDNHYAMFYILIVLLFISYHQFLKLPQHYSRPLTRGLIAYNILHALTNHIMAHDGAGPLFALG